MTGFPSAAPIAILCVSVALSAATFFTASFAQQAYPSRPIPADRSA
jgi:hypothetical protein